MPKYKIKFLQEVTQRLELEIEADSPEHAAKLARELEAGDEVQEQYLHDAHDWDTLWDCVTDPVADAIYGEPKPGEGPTSVPYLGTVDELDPEGADKAKIPRVLIEITGGCGYYVTEGQVNVLLVDYDNEHETNPDYELPAEWADMKDHAADQNTP